MIGLALEFNQLSEELGIILKLTAGVVQLVEGLQAGVLTPQDQVALVTYGGQDVVLSLGDQSVGRHDPLQRVVQFTGLLRERGRSVRPQEGDLAVDFRAGSDVMRAHAVDTGPWSLGQDGVIVEDGGPSLQLFLVVGAVDVGGHRGLLPQQEGGGGVAGVGPLQAVVGQTADL